MAKNKNTVPQSYPRIEDESSAFHGLLNTEKLMQHQKKIQKKIVYRFIS